MGRYQVHSKEGKRWGGMITIYIYHRRHIAYTSLRLVPPIQPGAIHCGNERGGGGRTKDAIGNRVSDRYGTPGTE